jgi:uncharacterized protein (TIGR03663 family)
MAEMKRNRTAWIFASIVLLAAALRLPALGVRPMHADEAVHAAKLGRLIEQGRYEYDPGEYHGPTLNYLTLLPARVSGAARYADLDEVILRSVPAVSGVLLVAAHALLVPVVGLPSAAVAALLAAISPAMVYYSRYYIQETLLVAFSFGALVSLCRYLRRPGVGWAVAVGASVGLMYATKETWVIAFGSMALAIAMAWTRERWRGVMPPRLDVRRPGVHLAAAGLMAIVVAGLFFSSFLTHPGGIVDSVMTYRNYLVRAGGAEWHVQPWHYYFDLLLFTRVDGGPIWTEGLIVGLAVVGLRVVWKRAHIPGADGKVLSILAGYTVIMAAAYAVIPYKTPWCLLGFLHGLVLLGGVGTIDLWARFRRPATRGLLAVCLLAAGAHLGWQAWAGSFRFAADPRNPYVYAHTGTGVFDIARRVEAVAAVHPQRLGMPIEVISGENLWPLPWYLRRFTAVRWETAPVKDAGHAPVILATPDMEPAIVRKLYGWRPPGERELYVPIFDAAVELRPQVELRGYAAKSLWDEYQRSMADLAQSARTSR